MKEKKKTVKRKKKAKKKQNKTDIQKLSISDLYALYLFVSHDGNNMGFGTTSPGAKAVVRNKQTEIEQELYIRAYGFNPFEEHKIVINGVKPEDIDLDKVAIVLGKNKEPVDEEPQTFVVVKNEKKEE